MQQPSAMTSLIGGIIGAMMALVGIWLGHTIGLMVGGEHAEAPSAEHESH